MSHKLKAEWEKHFGKKHDLKELQGTKHDQHGEFIDTTGVKTEVWEKDNVEKLNAMMTADWNAFLDGSDVYSRLSEEEQNRVRAEGPAYDQYNGD